MHESTAQVSEWVTIIQGVAGIAAILMGGITAYVLVKARGELQAMRAEVISELTKTNTRVTTLETELPAIQNAVASTTATALATLETKLAKEHELQVISLFERFNGRYVYKAVLDAELKVFTTQLQSLAAAVSKLATRVDQLQLAWEMDAAESDHAKPHPIRNRVPRRKVVYRNAPGAMDPDDLDQVRKH